MCRIIWLLKMERYLTIIRLGAPFDPFSAFASPYLSLKVQPHLTAFMVTLRPLNSSLTSHVSLLGLTTGCRCRSKQLNISPELEINHCHLVFPPPASVSFFSKLGPQTPHGKFPNKCKYIVIQESIGPVWRLNIDLKKDILLVIWHLMPALHGEHLPNSNRIDMMHPQEPVIKMKNGEPSTWVTCHSHLSLSSLLFLSLPWTIWQSLNDI